MIHLLLNTSTLVKAEIVDDKKKKNLNENMSILQTTVNGFYPNNMRDDEGIHYRITKWYPNDNFFFIQV